MHSLSDIDPGSYGLVYWYEKATYEISEEELQKLRQSNISNTLNATLMSHMHDPSKSTGDFQTVMQRGWNEAEKQRRMMEDGTVMKSEIFMIGDTNTIPRLEEIESSQNFRGWSNPYIIQMIKNA